MRGLLRSFQEDFLGKSETTRVLRQCREIKCDVESKIQIVKDYQI